MDSSRGIPAPRVTGRGGTCFGLAPCSCKACTCHSTASGVETNNGMSNLDAAPGTACEPEGLLISLGLVTLRHCSFSVSCHSKPFFLSETPSTHVAWHKSSVAEEPLEDQGDKQGRLMPMQSFSSIMPAVLPRLIGCRRCPGKMPRQFRFVGLSDTQSLQARAKPAAAPATKHAVWQVFQVPSDHRDWLSSPSKIILSRITPFRSSPAPQKHKRYLPLAWPRKLRKRSPPRPSQLVRLR